MSVGVLRYLELAKEDFSDAVYLYEDRRVRNAAYLLHQSVEKFLKYFMSMRDREKKIHDFSKLAEMTMISELRTTKSLKALERLMYMGTTLRYLDDGILGESEIAEVIKSLNVILSGLKSYVDREGHIIEMNLFNLE